MSILIERAENADQPELHQLWESVFGDAPETVQTFFDRFPPEAAGWVLREDGKIRAMAWLLPGSWLITEDSMQAAGYVYAVATAPEARGRGYAGQLMKAIMDFADQRSLLLYTRPAEESLVPWYADRMEAGSVGYMEEIPFTKSGISDLQVLPVEALEYQALREARIGSAPHLLLSEALLRVQKQYLMDAGGDLFQVGSGCCACEMRDGKLYVLELFADDAAAAMEALMQHFQVEKATLRKASDAAGTLVVCWRGAAPDTTNFGLFLE